MLLISVFYNTEFFLISLTVDFESINLKYPLSIGLLGRNA
ncbi:hypothetical protein C8N28_1444 [Albibacterium bauzanense]|uniref:Uncharacterized protein n=1 Tax=Albibacterium bauzanense TaxID=653929 RepID=A0A4R1M015_9SPHI|nr:hypothetical protein C8N28_1444 [Albibacterium bauzanense]